MAEEVTHPMCDRYSITSALVVVDGNTYPALTFQFGNYDPDKTVSLTYIADEETLKIFGSNVRTAVNQTLLNRVKFIDGTFTPGDADVIVTE